MKVSYIGNVVGKATLKGTNAADTNALKTPIIYPWVLWGNKTFLCSLCKCCDLIRCLNCNTMPMERKVQRKAACWLGGKNTATGTGISFEIKLMAITVTNSFYWEIAVNNFQSINMKYFSSVDDHSLHDKVSMISIILQMGKPRHRAVTDLESRSLISPTAPRWIQSRNLKTESNIFCNIILFKMCVYIRIYKCTQIYTQTYTLAHILEISGSRIPYYSILVVTLPARHWALLIEEGSE